jgi:hypothetical protein
METFRASVQYGDWEGTAAADDASHGTTSFEVYLEKKKLIKPNEFLVAASLWVGENHDNKLGSVLVQAFLFKGHHDFESLRAALAAAPDPIPVRAVDITLTLEEFIGLFKRFDVMLTWRGLSLEGREFAATED